MNLQDKYENLFFFDLETTGLDSKKDYIIELGAVSLKLDREKGKFVRDSEMDYLVKIPISVPTEIVNLTHITDEMLANDGILADELFKAITPFINEKTLVIGYNVQFDLNFLVNFYRENLGDPKFTFKNDILDVMAIYKDRYEYPHRLCNAIETFGVTIPNSHRAIDDINATLEVLKCLIKELIKDSKDLFKYINTLGYNPKYGVSGEKMPNVNYVPQDKYHKIA